MATRKDKADEAIEVQADDQAAAERADDEAVAAADDQFVETKDTSGNVVAESTEGEEFSTLAADVPDPSVEQPTPGGPGDEVAPDRVEKAEVLEAVTKPEVTSQNPEPYTAEELNHRFNHIPPEGYVERKFPVKQ